MHPIGPPIVFGQKSTKQSQRLNSNRNRNKNWVDCENSICYSAPGYNATFMYETHWSNISWWDVIKVTTCRRGRCQRRFATTFLGQDICQQRCKHSCDWAIFKTFLFTFLNLSCFHWLSIIKIEFLRKLCLILCEKNSMKFVSAHWFDLLASSIYFKYFHYNEFSLSEGRGEKEGFSQVKLFDYIIVL